MNEFTLNYTKINKFINIIVVLLLILMFSLMFLAMRGDSATMDELAHIPAGYSYIVKKDMRLNPEHPPLLKDLAGISVWLGSKLTATPIRFPDWIKSWQEDINGQWGFGNYFLFKAGNNPDKIIFWARLPILLITLLLGFYLFKWTRELYGNRAGLLALFLYCLSPTFLAHGHLVTTDVGASAGFFIATYYLIKWLKEPERKNLVIAGLVFGLALLVKFSLVLLIPYFTILTLVWAVRQVSGIRDRGLGIYFRSIFCWLGRLFLIGLIGLALIWPIYQYHVWGYPAERQHRDTEFLLSSFGSRALADFVVWLSDKPFLRAYGQFFLGLLMVMQRAAGGNTGYFLGEVSAAGWWYYFPIVFLIKVPLAFLILLFIALFFSLYQIEKPFWEETWSRLTNWMKNHFEEFAALLFIFIYWTATLRSNLNIGIRHILPTFPFLYLLVSGQVVNWLKIKLPTFSFSSHPLITFFLLIKTSLSWACRIWLKYFFVFCLLVWYLIGTLRIYPHFLAYFNESVGGPENGYKYVVDSNLDWGQDLKRLTQWVEEQGIEKIYLDYFGGADAPYYLKEKYLPWWGTRSPAELTETPWLAVSATFLQGGRGWPHPGFDQPTGYYRWLDKYKPVKIIGYSIFVYKIPLE